MRSRAYPRVARQYCRCISSPVPSVPFAAHSAKEPQAGARTGGLVKPGRVGGYSRPGGGPRGRDRSGFGPSPVPQQKAQVRGGPCEEKGLKGLKEPSYGLSNAYWLSSRAGTYTRTRDEWNWSFRSLQSLRSLQVWTVGTLTWSLMTLPARDRITTGTGTPPPAAAPPAPLAALAGHEH